MEGSRASGFQNLEASHSRCRKEKKKNVRYSAACGYRPVEEKQHAADTATGITQTVGTVSDVMGMKEGLFRFTLLCLKYYHTPPRGKGEQGFHAKKI